MQLCTRMDESAGKQRCARFPKGAPNSIRQIGKRSLQIDGRRKGVTFAVQHL